MPADAPSYTYVIDPNLEAVVNMAVRQRMPLLVTGEPGTGKTKLARYVADHMLQARLMVFNTKTTSKARDLLYHYNTLTHFRDSRQGEKVNPMDYISFQALGEAIIASRAQRHVVLIDEIDKAPRDFPNDVLFEFEHLAFEVSEASVKHVQEHAQRKGWRELVDEQGFIRLPLDAGSDIHPPFLILTSNSEKNLPDAFLRRCAYFHIPFPGRDRLLEIIAANGPFSEEFQARMVPAAVDHFLAIRKMGLRKAPATAELLAWIEVLQVEEIDFQAPPTDESGVQALKEKIRNSYSLLAKNKEDQEKLTRESKLL